MATLLPSSLKQEILQRFRISIIQNPIQPLTYVLHGTNEKGKRFRQAQHIAFRQAQYIVFRQAQHIALHSV